MKQEEKMIKTIWLTVKKILAATLVMAILATGTSFAQEKASGTSTPFKPKSEELAVGLSVIGTAIPWCLLLTGKGDSSDVVMLELGGTIIGPSLGYFYGGLFGRGLIGIGIRSLCFSSLVAGFSRAWDQGKDDAASYILAYGGLGGYIISTIYDIAAVSRAVRKRNESQKNVAFSLSPVVNPQKKAYGITVQLQF